jgi:hypothetical protein
VFFMVVVIVSAKKAPRKEGIFSVELRGKKYPCLTIAFILGM